jgi:hypothetical protein
MAIKNKQKDKKGKWLGLLAGAAFLGIAGVAANNFMSAKQQEIVCAPVEKYIGKEKRFGNDPGKRNLYIVFQVHNLKGFDLPEEISKEIDNKVAKIQVPVYRILEDLYKNKGLQVIACEGLDKNNQDDIENPRSFQETMERSKGGLTIERAREISRNDGVLEKLIAGQGLPAHILVSWMYEDLYAVGQEDKEIMDRAADYAQKMQNLVLIKKVEGKDKEMFDEWNSEFGKLNRERSLRAIYNSMENSNKLYNQGKVKNRDVAIVIGMAHLDDYTDLAVQAEQGKTDFNIIMIVPDVPGDLK